MRLFALMGIVVVGACQPPAGKSPPPTDTKTKARKVVPEKPWKPTYPDPPVSSKVTKVETLVAQMTPTPVDNAAPDVAAPFSLTAADGSGLIVTRIDAKAVVEGPIAF